MSQNVKEAKSKYTGKPKAKITKAIRRDASHHEVEVQKAEKPKQNQGSRPISQKKIYFFKQETRKPGAAQHPNCSRLSCSSQQKIVFVGPKRHPTAGSGGDRTQPAQINGPAQHQLHDHIVPAGTMLRQSCHFAPPSKTFYKAILKL